MLEGAAAVGWVVAVCSIVSLVVVVRKQRTAAFAAAYDFSKGNGQQQNVRQSNQMKYAGGNPRMAVEDL
jgi:hypothetical protein